MSRKILNNVLSGTKAGFKAILNFEHAIERKKKMENQKSKSTFSAILLSLILMVAAFWVSPAAAQKYVTDPSTGKIVTAPEYGGTFTYAQGGEPPHVDSYLYSGAGLASGVVVEQLGIVNWAVDRDKYAFSSQFVPLEVAAGQLAESWERPDATTIVFHIRQGVHWHDKAPMNGRALTARDIEFNYHRLLGLGSGFTEPVPGGRLKGIPFESITATDDATVVFKLKEPNPGALKTILVDDEYGFILPPEVIKQHGDLQDWRNLVGTGPYELTDWVQGTSFTRTRISDYWGFDEKYPQNRLPYIDKLVALLIKEEATYIAGLRAGRIDYLGFTGGISDITSVDIVDSLRNTNPEIKLFPWWDRAETAYALPVDQPPFDDIRVRKALQMALDVKTINDTHYKGTGLWKPQGIVGEAFTGYYTPFDQWPDEVKAGYAYDPEGAKQLLAQAGYPNGFKTIINHFGEFDLGYTEIAAAYWKAIGVDAEIRDLDRPQFLPLITEGKMEGLIMTLQGFNMSGGPATVLRWRTHSASAPMCCNWANVKDAELDAKIEAAEATTDLAEQQRLVKEVDMYLIKQHYYVWGPKTGKYMAIQPWVKGYNGEVHFGPQNRHPVFARLWIDQELKKEMGF